MKLLLLPLIVASPVLTGCRNDERTSSAAQDWEAQMKQYQAQLDVGDKQARRTDEQQAKADAQQKRMDKVLDKWEEQGKRLDAILDRLEKSSGTNK